MTRFSTVLCLPLVLISCATYNGREFSDVYNQEYRQYVAQPFDDMTERAHPDRQVIGILYFRGPYADSMTTSSEDLEAMARAIAETEGSVLISGYANDTVDWEENKKIAAGRAEHAKKLLQKSGVAMDRVRVETFAGPDSGGGLDAHSKVVLSVIQGEGMDGIDAMRAMAKTRVDKSVAKNQFKANGLSINIEK